MGEPTQIKGIVKYLLNEFNINEVRFSDEMASQFLLSEKTIENWLLGRVNPSKTGRKYLCEYFSIYVARLNPSDFSLTAEQFIKKVSSNRNRSNIDELRIPLFGEGVSPDQLQKDYRNIKGVYQTYRYAFENTGIIAKEYIIVDGFDSASNLIKVKMIGGSNTSLKNRNSKYLAIETFSGRIICLGNTFYLMLSSEGSLEDANPRIRFITLEKTEHHFLYDKFRYGILLSRSSYFGTPAASRILLEKVNSNLDKGLNYQSLKNNVKFVTQENVPKNILEVISNDIKRNHMGVREDYILRTSTSDLIELMRPN